jgi:hypothetical protein
VLHVDEAHGEVYVGAGGSVRIYNLFGMEEHDFFHDTSLGTVMSLVAEPSGDILVLSFRPTWPERPGASVVTRYDFRGRPRETFEINGIPKEFEGFVPNVMRARGERLVFAELARLRAIETDRDGSFLRGWDLSKVVEGADPAVDERDRARREGGEIEGFAVDAEGRFLFTIPVRFRGFRFDPGTGEAEPFGRPGATAGKFGVAAGIAGDDRGYVYVADRGRGVVLIFDPALRFLREFGNRGGDAARLRRPGTVAYGRNRVFVSQVARRGVSVFSVYTDPVER